MGTTAAELLERVEQLVPVVADRAAETERLRQLPDETIADLAAADVFRALVPARFGGHQLEVDVVHAIGRTLARACPSTGWVAAFLVGHNWIAAQFPLDTQEEVFAERGYVLAPAALTPSATLTRVDGGYRLTGRTSWGSGSRHADWVQLSALVVEDGEVIDARMLMAPAVDVRFDDVWHTDGMRGTGSDDIVAADVFVPHRRTVSLTDLFVGGTSPGAEALDADVYRRPFIPFLATYAAAPALGAAEGALAAFRHRLADRILAYTLGDAARERPAAQMRLARATTLVRSAAARHEATVRELVDGPLGRDLDPLADATLRLDAASVVSLARSAIDHCCAGAGGSIHFLDQPLQRFQRDIHTMSGHAIFDEDRAAETYGRLAVGLPPDPTRII